jgi:signal transduction histidine kinase
MRPTPNVLAAACFAAVGVAVACGAESRARTGPLPDWVGRRLSREFREVETRRDALALELATLPSPAGQDTSNRLGWHSHRLPSPGTTTWVQVDLGEARDIDTVALVPASGEADGKSGPGYGFPLRFRIELADEATFRNLRIVADFTAADVPNPRAFPVVATGSGWRARFVRVTATQAWPRREHWIVALGEIIVLAGPHNVAAGRPVQASHSVSARPMWDTANLTDEHSVLGPPVGPGPSPTNGYLAVQEREPGVVKWVQVDLGREYALDEIRLFPSRPTDFADAPGSGFPDQFRIEGGSGAEFSSSELLFDATSASFPHPGENIVTVRLAGRRARVVRVTATRLHDRGKTSSFALAELEVWSGGANVALGRAVTALDRYASAEFPRWAPEYLVDGYNSRHPVLGWPGWLQSLARRRELESEAVALGRRHEVLAAASLGLLLQIAGGAIAALAAGIGLNHWRTRRAQRRAVVELRRQIASDLHDEIGSYLGSIRMVSEAARRQTSDPVAQQDFSEIAQTAACTGQALREIVWLLDTAAISRPELVARMRATAPTLLPDIACEFDVPERLREEPCALEFTRNVWLIFKESLHNVARHAGARRVQIAVREPAGGFELTIADDGAGFRESEIEPGRGLHSLRQRAAQLHGELTIESAPNRGTRIHLSAPPHAS